MMEIYFDDVLINEDYYTSLSTNFALFNDTFYLGSTAANTYNISIAKEAVTTQPNIVTIKDNGVLIATLVVDKIEEDDFEYKYTLTDKMVNLEFKYDASQIFNNGSATLLEIAQDICDKAGIILATMDFRGYDKSISWYDNTRTAREYIGYIAELNGGYAQIGKDGRLYFVKHHTPSISTISIDDCENFNIGEKHKISRVVFELGSLKYPFGDETGNTLYLNGDNVFITEESEVEEIYNEIKGFEFYSFNTSNCPIDYEIMAGQVIKFTDGINNYPTIASYDLVYSGGWYGGYSLDVATKKQEETKIVSNEEKIRDLSIKVDREAGKITEAIKEIDDQNQKIAQVTKSVDELNSKIQDIADITTFGESMYAKVELDSINESEPIQITVKPTVENISYLYPHENLFPSDDLFLKDRKIRFTNKSLEETDPNKYIDYILPDDLLIAPDGTYDEFYLGYDEQVCQITKRCQYNADGTVSKLEKEQIIALTPNEYPKIELKDGDYTIELLGYTNAYLSLRLMAQNIYTTQFATKSEVKSEISQKADEVNISVDKKLSNYSTTTQMNSAINVKANEITSNVSTTYATKTELNTTKSEIKQTTDSISSTVSKKVGNDEIISKINQSAETVGISADKIELSANDVLNLLAGNTINLSSKNIVISSDALTIKKDGTMILKGTSSATDIFRVQKSSDSSVFSYIQPIGAGYVNGSSDKSIYIFVGDTSSSVDITDVNGNTSIAGRGIRTPSVTQTSVEKDKKNFETLNNGLEIIKNTDIYKYNLKSQKDTDKKHIGFVIGDNYNYSQEITSENNDGVDTYSMISVAYKAIQELAEENRELKHRVEALEKGENNGKD